VVRRHSKRLPMSTDLDDLLRQDDDMFMPPAQEAAPATKDITPAAEQPADKPKRPGRLDKVVEMEAVADEAPEPDYIPPGEPVTVEQEYPI
jgi:recombination protein RecT